MDRVADRHQLAGLPIDGRLRNHEAGFVTIAQVAAAGLAMIFFAILTNFIVMQYALGVVTAGLDEGVRQGARSGDVVGACLARIDSSIAAVDGGAIMGINRTCGVQGEWVVARLDAQLVGWAPLVPSMSFTREARAPLEGL